MIFVLLAQAQSNPAFADTPSYGALFVKMVLAMIFIIGLALFSLKYLLPKLVGMKRRADSRIQILDYQALDQKRLVYLIKIDDKQIAVGASDQGLAKLAEWEIPESK